MLSDYDNITMSVELAALLHNISYYVLQKLVFASFVYISYPTVLRPGVGSVYCRGHNAYEITFAHKIIATIFSIVRNNFFRVG